MVINQNMSKIKDNLYLGDSDDAKRIADKNDTNIVILSCAYETDTRCDLKLSLFDGKNDDTLELFDDGAKFINDNLNIGKIVFAHCVAGVSRSASVVIYYLMKYDKMKYRDAYETVKKCRPIIAPNNFFVNVLLHENKKMSDDKSKS